jgi:murein DD-endopeptidase MepM/ murein hydrolase activator NlpD
LENIAEQYSVSLDTIRWANNLDPKAPIKPGQELVILPVDGVLHTVTRGQTLLRIAELYEIPVDSISEQNGIEGGYILAGQQLIIPAGKPIVAKPTQVATKPPTQGGGDKPVTTPGKAPDVSAEPSIGVLQMPCNGCSYTQYFHPGHYAVDIQKRGGDVIFAAEAGTVIRADTGWNGGYGNVIEVDHGNGLVTLYGHNKELYVKVGDKVTRGQAIAFMGNTGRVYGKTGIHVHFEVRVNGVKKNPLLYLQ